MEESRIRIANPLKTVVLIPNSTWDRGRLGYIAQYCAQQRFPGIPVVIVEDTWKKAGYDKAWYGAHKQHDSIYDISKGDFESVIYVQDDVLLMSSIYTELLNCELMWEMFAYNRQKIGLLVLPGYIVWLKTLNHGIDFNLYRIAEQVQIGYCNDICRFGGQVMIANRELICRVLRLWNSYNTCLFDDLMWRMYAKTVINLIPSMYQHSVVQSTWKKRDCFYRTCDMVEDRNIRIRFTEVLDVDEQDRKIVGEALNAFWYWVTVEDDNQSQLHMTVRLNENQLNCLNRIMKKVCGLASGNLGESLWHNYQLFLSNLDL